MTDRHGTPIAIGDRVQWKTAGRSWPVVGVVRDIKVPAWNHRTGAEEARCDDGEPGSDDPKTNGFHVAEWVPSRRIEVIR
jgi:hypothetical protein